MTVSLRLLAIATFVGCLAAGPVAAQTDVTFTRDIAPIIFANCSSCHRPGESAPFSLLTYDDVRRRGRQIRMVTQSRYMPPWLPDPKVVSFAAERRLTDEEIERIRVWVENGTPEGDPADLPPLPKWPEGWQLGQPDLVIHAPETYTVPADGVDVFRNLVIPVPVKRTRYVRAVELRPGNPAVVHHAIIQVDRTQSNRRLDAADPEPGYGGMSMGKSEPPDGTFIGWTPGNIPSGGSDEMAWRLDPGVDLVLQLHMLPSGKPEPIRPTIGLFFAPGPPEVPPFAITLRNDLLDIPPGEPDYVATDRFTVPVPVDVHLVYPHAHYLGKDLKAYATPPDGSRRWLVHIPDWDFNWQDEYRCDPPIRLPAGSVIELEYTYDNSTDNIRNPHDPPKRVRFGNQSSDEMCTLTVQVHTDTTTDRATLAEAYDIKSQEALILWAGDLARRDPSDARAFEVLGTAYSMLGRTDEALDAYREALLLRPDFPDALVNLGTLYGKLGRHDDAVRQFRRVIELEPTNAVAHNNVGVALEAAGDLDGAIDLYRAAVGLEPDYASAQFNLGSALARTGRNDAALEHLRAATALQPDHVTARVNIAAVLSAQLQHAAAVEEMDAAIRVAPDAAPAHFNRATALLALGRTEEAIKGFETTVRFDPSHVTAHANLGIALRREGRAADGLGALQRAAELDPSSPSCTSRSGSRT